LVTDAEGVSQGGVMNWALLLSVLILIESPKTPEQATKEEARGYYGPLQISRHVVDDINEFYAEDLTWLGRKLSVEDCRSEVVSRWVCHRYLLHWGARYTKDTGKTPDAEVYSKIWNGGPRGWEKKSTEVYWQSVKAALEKAQKAERPWWRLW